MQKEPNKYRLFLFRLSNLLNLSIDVLIERIYNLKTQKEKTIRDNVLAASKAVATAKKFDLVLDIFEKEIKDIEKQIRDKLAQKGFDSLTIEVVLERLENYRYISDKVYAKSYVGSVKGKSKRELECALLKKGISRYNIMDAIENSDVDDEKAASIVAEKFMKYKEKTQENQQKLYARLYRKGYSVDCINSVINKWFNE